MGELISEKPSEGVKKNKSDNDDGPINVVLKMDLHCEGCVNKISQKIRRFEGVKKVSGDITTNKVTVTGKVDPAKLKELIESKINKKVDLISPQLPKKKNNNNSGSANGSGDDDKQKKTKAEDKSSEKKNKQATVAVLKTPLHCKGCIDKMQKLISKTKGVEELTIDDQKETITVKGTMEVKALQSSLQDKLKRGVDVVLPKKDKNDNGGDKKDNRGGGEKNKKDNDGGGGGGVFSTAEYNNHHFYGPMQYGPQLGYYPQYVHAPQYFSDENPNACSIM